MNEQADPDPAPARNADITDSQGFQVGDGNIQVNFLFGGRQPSGPVVAGNVPQAPPAFQPRDDLMAQLRAAGPGVSVVRALAGMRGVGKTQLAAAYARECIEQRWRLVAWINAGDLNSLLSGLAVVAVRLGIDRAGSDVSVISEEVRNRLEADGEQCLLVYDNVADPDVLRPYIPAAGNAQVVITSTQASVLVLGRPTRVDVFAERESLAFLSERTGLQDPSGAITVAAELGHLPLALAQAAAVIAARRLTYPVYLDRLRSHPAGKYLPQATGEPYPRGVAKAILLSIDSAAATDTTGLVPVLLTLVSLLSPGGVPRDLLYLGRSAGIFAATAETVDEALAHLASASLLSFSGDSDAEPSLTVHRLVARVVRERAIQEGTLTQAGQQAYALLAKITASLGVTWQHRAAARDLVQQMLALSGHLAPHLAAGHGQWAKELLHGRSWALGILNELGDSADLAIEVGSSLVPDSERVLGEDDPATLISRNQLAHAYLDGGRLNEALPLLERTLADCGRVLGDEHAETLRSRSNLASAYRVAGRFSEALALLERALADRVRLLGDDHPATWVTRESLAFTYQEAGRLGEALPLYERVLAGQARRLGEDHPSTLISLSSLATVYHRAGRWAEALPLYERVLAAQERVFGEDHPITLGSRNNLAYAYQEAGRGVEAIALYERTLADRVRLLGEEHPDTLVSRNNLAWAYQEAGRLGEALPLFERTLADRVRLQGAENLDTLVSRGNLARAYQEAGRLGEALPLFGQTLADRVRLLGEDHPDTLRARHYLAGAYLEEGRAGEALPLYERTLADRVRLLGEEHPDTLKSRGALARAYQAAGRMGEALLLYEKALAGLERALGPEHPDSVLVRKNLACARGEASP